VHVSERRKKQRGQCLQKKEAEQPFECTHGEKGGEPRGIT